LIAVYDRRSLRTKNFTADIGATLKLNEMWDIKELEFRLQENSVSPEIVTFQSRNTFVATWSLVSMVP